MPRVLAIKHYHSWSLYVIKYYDYEQLGKEMVYFSL